MCCVVLRGHDGGKVWWGLALASLGGVSEVVIRGWALDSWLAQDREYQLHRGSNLVFDFSVGFLLDHLLKLILLYYFIFQ